MVNPFARRSILQTSQRSTHTYVIGQPGSGKSRLLESWILQDIAAGKGLCLIDPHGDLFQNVLSWVAQYPSLWNRVVIINPIDKHWAVQLNPLYVPPGTSAERIAWFLTDIILKIWKLESNQAPRMTWLMANTFSALADLKLPITATARFLMDVDFREPLVDQIENEGTRFYFQQEFPTTLSVVREWVSPLLNKLGSFLHDPDISAMFTISNGIDIRDLMNQRCIILVQIPKGILGENTSNLLGAFIVAQTQQAALSRSTISEREPFYLYLDEFQNYTTNNISDILSEARKYQLSMVLAHQYLAQLDEDIQAAVLNTSGTIACFRTGFDDAIRLAKHVFPTKDFNAKVKTQIDLQQIKSILIPRVREIHEQHDWDNLAYLISNQNSREFWVRIRSAKQPAHLHSHDVPTISRTRQLEEKVRQLVDTSGRRYAKLKRSDGGQNNGLNDSKNNPSMWSQ
ncbi:MAG: type IV secretion system DNA-binding domain-containing protein [Pelolinea sp.]|nr:type IV secretion system DNA-binding domain-containing protein [Pelolinea sp.]